MSLTNYSSAFLHIMSRNIEGTFPGTPKTGIWLITAHRVQYGWGAVNEDTYDPDYENTWPVDVPRESVIEEAKKYRSRLYYHVRNSHEFKSALRREHKVGAAFEIGSEWLDSADGLFTEETPHFPVVGSHCVHFDKKIQDSILEMTEMTHNFPDRLFMFINTWGLNWGTQGIGALTSEYFDSNLITSIACERLKSGSSTPSSSSLKRTPLGTTGYSFAKRKEGFDGFNLYCLDVYNEKTDDLIAWSIVKKDFNTSELKVHDLFVKEDYRRKGIGSALFNQIIKDTKRHVEKLSFLVSYADSYPSKVTEVWNFFKKFNFVLTPSEEVDLGYMATFSNSTKELKAVRVPQRPASPPGQDQEELERQSSQTQEVRRIASEIMDEYDEVFRRLAE